MLEPVRRKHGKILKVNSAVRVQVGYMRKSFEGRVYRKLSVSQGLSIMVCIAAGGDRQKYVNFLAGTGVNDAGALTVVSKFITAGDKIFRRALYIKLPCPQAIP